MDFVLTLIAGTGLTLSPRLLEEAATLIARAGGVPQAEVGWLSETRAADIFFANGDTDSLRRELTALWREEPVDFCVQATAHRRKKLLVSDMDSTMITVECIDELADFAGLKAQVSAITERAMNGELDFEAALTQRVALLKGLPETVLAECYAARVRMMPGAKALVRTMKAQGAYCLLVSGGFTFFTSRVARELGFDAEASNQLLVAEGKLTGAVAQPILGKEAKLASLQKAVAERGLKMEETLAIGDGANDLPMLLAAGLGVAYHAKPVVQAAAGCCVNHNDLTAVLYFQGYRDAEFIL